MTSMTSAPDASTARVGGGWLIGFGVVLLILGIVALLNVVNATMVTAAIVGLVLAVAGLVQLIGAFVGTATMGERVLHAVVGVLYLIVGVMAFADPLKGAIAITFVLGVMLIAEGIIRIYGAFAWRSEYKWLHVVLGGITILLGIWLLTNIPVSGLAIGFFVGFGLLMAGFSWIALGWAVRSIAKRSSIA